MTELSKRQQKILRNQQEQQAFLLQREQFHIDAFERDLEQAVAIFENEKHEMSEEDQAAVEEKIAENRALIKTLRGINEEDASQ